MTRIDKSAHEVYGAGTRCGKVKGGKQEYGSSKCTSAEEDGGGLCPVGPAPAGLRYCCPASIVDSYGRKRTFSVAECFGWKEPVWNGSTRGKHVGRATYQSLQKVGPDQDDECDKCVVSHSVDGKDAKQIGLVRQNKARQL
jgi:hypothetical protein